jgi:hypothetical protein
MQLNELEKYVLAYFLAGDAITVTVEGRFYGRAEFVRVFEDRIFYATQQLGAAAARRHPAIANYLVDKLIEEKALSSVNDQYTGISHQFDDGKYRTVVRALIESNSICERAQAAGQSFWEETFTRLGKS